MSDAIDSSMIDPIALARDLIRCPSVTPEDAGALAVLEEALKSLGFSCHRLPFKKGMIFSDHTREYAAR